MHKAKCTALSAAIALFLLISCSKPAQNPNAIEVWFHSGQESERNVIQDQVRRFNAAQDTTQVNLVILPEGSYNQQVQAASLSGNLPDVLEFDGPFLYNYVWQKQLLPLDDLLSPETLTDLLPSLIDQGTYKGNLYAVGTFDSGLGLYGNRRLLETAGIRIPQTPREAWSLEEFESNLQKLSELDEDGAVLDLKVNYDGEWYTYAFSPALQSAGGDLIDRNTYQSSERTLNGPESIRALEHIQSWFEAGYIDPNMDDASFIDGKTALSWVGHWEYPRYSQSLENDLVLMPLPNFGKGSKTGQGSWAWAITRNCKNKEAAARFLEFLLQPEEILVMTNANGAVPARRSAVRLSPLYGGNGPLRLFVEQLDQTAVPRPKTPAYPIITSVFQRAFDDIRNGVKVKTALDRAVSLIDQDIRDNKGYPDS